MQALEYVVSTSLGILSWRLALQPSVVNINIKIYNVFSWNQHISVGFSMYLPIHCIFFLEICTFFSLKKTSTAYGRNALGVFCMIFYIYHAIFQWSLHSCIDAHVLTNSYAL